MPITPIKLPLRLKDQIKRRAALRKLSLSAYVRECLQRDVQSNADWEKNPFTGVPAWKGPMPRYGSMTLDRQLYGKRP